MKLIDFFRFPAVSASESGLFQLSDDDMKSCLEKSEHADVKHAMVALFDSGIVNRNSQTEMIYKSSLTGDYSFAYMPELEGSLGEEQIDAAAEMGCRAVVFHPYLQKIGRNLLERVEQLARHAATKGMFTCVCSAYGSKDIFRYAPLETVVVVAEATDVPVVIVHGGGAKVMDAFLIAEAFPHVYLDTSFSLHYWLDSPVEEIFAFAIRRLGVDRWMFGSDAPFMQLDETIDRHYEFCDRHGFTKVDIECLMGGTAATVLGL